MRKPSSLGKKSLTLDAATLRPLDHAALVHGGLATLISHPITNCEGQCRTQQPPCTGPRP